jgi:hypothetical protein
LFWWNNNRFAFSWHKKNCNFIRCASDTTFYFGSRKPIQ